MRTVYPAGGWLPSGASVSWQRNDQGKDFVTNWRGIIQAPGAGVVIAVAADRPFPNGFGPAFPLVRIDSGPFAGHVWYLGHTTSLVRGGDRFSFGHPLARADQGRPSMIGINVPGDGGWVELGNQMPNGRLGPNSPAGHWFDRALVSPLVVSTPDPPLRFGDQGWRVIGLSSNLQAVGLLPRMFWRFGRDVHGAVVLFKQRHGIALPRPPADRGVVDARTDLAIKHAADAARTARRARRARRRRT